MESHASVRCGSLLVAGDVDPDDGEEWVFGLPFFRKYYTTFMFGEQSAEGHGIPRKRPSAKKMAFSVADNDCQPSSEAKLVRREQDGPVRSYRFPASKLRVNSRWLRSETKRHSHKR